MAKFILIIFSVFSVYLNSIFNPFIWDDFSLIVENPYIKNFKLSIKSFSIDIYSGTSNFYRPLQIILYSLIYKIFKLNPFAYHLFNILLHSACSILFFILLKEIYEEKEAFLFSLLWGIHPINTESITYISGTADPLFLFFGLLSIYFYRIYLSSSKKKFLFFSCISLIFSLLSKETGVLILPLFLLYFYCLGKLKKEEVKNYGLIISIFLIYLILRQSILKFGKEEINEIFLHRFYTGFAAFLIYISILLFPFVLSVERHIPYIETFKNIDFISGFLYFIIFIFFIYIKRKDKKLFFAGIIFLLNFLFHSNILIPLNGNLREHWMYLGGIGFFIYFLKILNKIKGVKIKNFFLFTIFLLYGTRTIIRNCDWKNPEVFYLKAIKYSHYPTMLYGNLSYYYLRNGDYEKSYKTSLKAISIGLKNETILYIYGVSLSTLGKNDEAIGIFNEIIKKNPKNYEALTELGELYFLKGEMEKAKNLLKRSLMINNFYPKTYYLLSEINRIEGNKEEFLKNLEILNFLVPEDFYPYYLRGLFYKENGEFEKAKSEFYKSYFLLRNKKDFNSNFYMAILMREMGMIENSLNLLLKLLKEKGENPSIMNEIGICYALKGEKEKAKKIWEEILIKNPSFYPAKENLKRLKF